MLTGKGGLLPWRVVQTASVALLLLTAGGCNGGMGCPMGYAADDPIVHIRDARNSATGARIPLLVLSSIKIGGRLQQTGDMSFLVPLRARNVAIDGVTLRCTVACDFAAERGSYEFTASAPGYRDRVVSLPDVRPTQSERVGDCGYREFGGVDVSVILDPL